MGQLVMPRSRVRAIAVHGTMRLLRRTSAARRWFDELGIKPQNAFTEGLLVRGGNGRRGTWLPQGLVRSPSGSIAWSDQALGSDLALVGLGADPNTYLSEHDRSRWLLAGGRTLRFAHRGEGRSTGAVTYEDLDGRLLPGAAPHGWCFAVRPDRTVLHDGPITEASRVVRESLALLRAPSG
jgi:3-(3-hydroxy-phenyl)propionate hydroxylase